MSVQRRGDYMTALINDQDAPLTPEQVAWLGAQPSPIAQQLRNLAELCDLAQQRPDGVTPDGTLRWVRDRLRALAGEVGD